MAALFNLRKLDLKGRQGWVIPEQTAGGQSQAGPQVYHLGPVISKLCDLGQGIEPLYHSAAIWEK